jgi:hypothetical protein
MGRRRGTRIDTIAALDMETMRPMYGFGAQHFGPIAKAMGVRFPSGAGGYNGTVLPANNTETLVATSTPLILPFDNAIVFLLMMLNILAGTGTTSISLSIRLGPLITSPLLGAPFVHTLAAGNSASIPLNTQHNSAGAAGPLQYSMTVIQTGATAAGTVNLASVMAFAL